MNITNKNSKLYNIYTRLTCNFVFPEINNKINGYNRPKKINLELNFNDDIEKEEKLILLKQ
jgi:hypothetical protein